MCRNIEVGGLTDLKLVYIKVLKLRPNRTVQLGKLWTSHNHSSLNLRTGLCQKRREPFELRFNHTVLRTVIKPLFTVPFESEPKKKKKRAHTHTQKNIKKKKHNCWEEQPYLTLLHSQKTSQIIQTQNTKQNLILTIKLNQNKQIWEKRKEKNKPIWSNLVVGRRTNGSGAADEVVLVNADLHRLCPFGDLDLRWPSICAPRSPPALQILLSLSSLFSDVNWICECDKW